MQALFSCFPAFLIVLSGPLRERGGDKNVPTPPRTLLDESEPPESSVRTQLATAASRPRYFLSAMMLISTSLPSSSSMAMRTPFLR
jgi:hypothetical protein